MNLKNVTIVKLGDTSDINHSPIGEPEKGYPQISIRTNRTSVRTDLYEVIAKANSVADLYPENKEERAAKVTEALSTLFGSGSFGHAWVIVFNSDKPEDYSSYAYHDGFGYVKNNDTGGETDDSADRGFYAQFCMPITPEKINFLEKVVIPALNKKSEEVGAVLSIHPKEGREGVYSPITNCSWFAGYLWNQVTGKKLEFTQQLNGSKYAEKWGIDALESIAEISDPGVISESISGISYEIYHDYIFDSRKSLDYYDLVSDEAILDNNSLILPPNTKVKTEALDFSTDRLQLVLREAKGTFFVYSPVTELNITREGNGEDLSFNFSFYDLKNAKYLIILNTLAEENSFNGYSLGYWQKS